MKRPDAGIALLLFAVSAAVYLADHRPIPCGDSRPVVYLASSLIHERNLDLNEFPSLYRPAAPYFVRWVGRKVYSAFTLGPALMDVPVHLLFDLARTGHTTQRFLWEELTTASLATAGSVAFLYLAALGFAPRRIAFASALLYAFATAAWSTCSMNLWQHGPSTLCTAAGLAALAHSDRRPSLAGWAGLPLGFGVVVRTPNVVILAILGLAVLIRDRGRRAPGFALAALPGIALWAGCNLATFGSVLGGYEFTASRNFWVGPFGKAVAANLVSPNRGLLFSSPFLVFALAPAARVLLARGDSMRKLALLSAAAYLAVCSKYTSWWGGWCYGPRYTSDIVPLVCLFLPDALRSLSGRHARTLVFVCLAVLSVGMHAIGVRSDASRTWNAHPDVNQDPDRRVWALADAQVLAGLRYRAWWLPRAFLAVWFPHDSGDDRADRQALRGSNAVPLVRHIGPTRRPGEVGTLMHSLPIRLARGAYLASFVLRTACVPDPERGPVARLQVLKRGLDEPIAEQAIGGADREKISYEGLTLPFEVRRRTRVSFRVLWEGKTGCELWLREIDLARAARGSGEG